MQPPKQHTNLKTIPPHKHYNTLYYYSRLTNCNNYCSKIGHGYLYYRSYYLSAGSMIDYRVLCILSMRQLIGYSVKVTTITGRTKNDDIIVIISPRMAYISMKKPTHFSFGVAMALVREGRTETLRLRRQRRQLGEERGRSITSPVV